jgi:mRNA interferase MazF
VSVEIAEGLKYDSSIHCDELVSLPKSVLTHYIGTLSPSKLAELNKALLIALALDGAM